MKAEFEKYIANPEEYYRDCYEKLGIRRKADEIISSLSQMAEPVRYTHQLWYSKTKPVLPAILTLDADIEPSKIVIAGAAIDVLWTLSVVVDDIQDKDETRRAKPAAWKVFGGDFTYKSAEAGLETTVRYLGKEIGPEAGRLCLDRVNLGMMSIKKHQTFDLSVRPETLRRNYWERDAFFSALPIEILIPNPENSIRKAALACLENYYIGGQLGNDLQDLTRVESDGRLRMSDIKNGLVTIPIQKLWATLNPKEKTIFEKVFGKIDINSADFEAISKMIEAYHLRDQILSDISESYDQAKTLSTVVMNQDDSQIFSALCESQKRKFSL